MKIGIIAIGLIVLVTVSIMALPAYAKGKPPVEAGNCLSYPVIWAEGVTITLPGIPGEDPALNGLWWYQWGTNGVDPDVTPASCAPDPDNESLCDDGVAGTFDPTLVPGEPPADNPLPLARAYLQKDPQNLWQAETFPAYPLGGGSVTPPADTVQVDLIDWGDNLESVDWTTRSKVRTEVVLFEDAIAGDTESAPFPMLEYEMRHTSGWGIDEVHGIAAAPVEPFTAYLGDGNRSTVFSNCARFTIQKLNVAREDIDQDNLTWVPGEGWDEVEGYPDNLINAPIYNSAVYEGGVEGPGAYSAEINVKGRIIYGYTWDVRKLNDDGAGDYRLTFSLDDTCSTVSRNTAFVEGVTNILVPLEILEAVEAEPVEGGVGVLDTANNLTYMDIRILQKGR